MHYSKTTGGFYTEEIHGGNIPKDAVEITVEEYVELLTGQSSGMVIEADSAGFPKLVSPPASTASKLQNKLEATSRLATTDWVNQPDVYDPANTPHLINRNAFLAYRSQVRAIAVNPVDGNLDWPTEPTAAWSA